MVFFRAGVSMKHQAAASSLWEANKKLGRYKESLEMYELFVSTKDSIESEENQKAVIRQEYKFEYEKQKALDDSEHEKTIAIEKEKQRNQYIIILISALSTFLILILLLIIYRRLRLTKEQKYIIEDIMKNKNITQIELSKKYDVNRETIKRDLKKLKELKLIKRVGSDKTGYWKLMSL